MRLEDEVRRARAAARQGRALIRKGRVAPVEADLSPISGADAISLLTRLSRESFQLTGVEEPAYERSAVPVQFVPRSSR